MDFALSGQRIDHRPRCDHHIERCAVFDSALERISRIVIDREAKPTRALEQRPELAQYLLDGVGTEDLDIGHLHPTVAKALCPVLALSGHRLALHISASDPGRTCRPRVSSDAGT